MKIELTDSEWISLLDGEAEDSNLPMCCANISALRNSLVSVVRNGRNNEIEAFTAHDLKQRMKWVIDGHDLDNPVLKKLAEQIGFDPETAEHTPRKLEF